MSKKVKKRSLPYQSRKEIKDSVNKMVQSQARTLLEKMQQEATEQVVWRFGVVMCWVLRKRLDWGRKRLSWILAEVTSDFEAMCDGYVSFDDITQELFEETGLDMRTMDGINNLSKGDDEK